MACHACPASHNTDELHYACGHCVLVPAQIIYCAGSRIQFTGEYQRVENVGVSYIARAWLDTRHRLALRANTRAPSNKIRVADFKKEEAQDTWDLLFCGALDGSERSEAQDQAQCLISEDGKRLVFNGARIAPAACSARGCRPLHALAHAAGALRVQLAAICVCVNTFVQAEYMVVSFKRQPGRISSNIVAHLNLDYQHASHNAGAVFSRTGIAEWGGPMPGNTGFEGWNLQFLADGKPYACILVDDEVLTILLASLKASV